MSSQRRRRKKDDGSLLEGLFLFITNVLAYVALILLLVAFVFCCGYYFVMFSRSVQELSALDSIHDRGFVALSSTDRVDPSLDGHVVFVQGKVTTQDTLQDPHFPFSAHALVFYTDVWFYQWDERRPASRRQRNSPPSYTLDWDLTYRDGASFNKPKNNTLIFPLKPFSVYSKNNTLGAYTIAPSLLEEFPERHAFPLAISPEILHNVKEKILQHANTLQVQQKSILQRAQTTQVQNESMQTYFSRPTQQESTPLAALWSANELFLGLDVHNPRAGDMRIRYFYIPEQTVSFFARVQGNTLHLFVDEDGNASKDTIHAGKVDMEKILSETKETNIISFVVNVFTTPFGIWLLLFILLQCIFPEGFRRRDYSRSALYNNARKSLIYSISLVIFLSLFSLAVIYL